MGTPAVAAAKSAVLTHPAASAQYGRLDIVRFGACLSVIGTHVFSAGSVPWANRLGFWAAPFFFLAAGLLSSSRMADTAWLRSRVLRLALLAVLWIALGRVIQLVQLGVQYSPKQLAGDLLLGASWGHLWFLPALLMVTVAGWIAQRFGIQRLAIVVGGVIGLVVLALFPVLSSRWANYLYRAPAFWFVFFALPLAIDMSTLKGKMRWGALPGLGLMIGAGWAPLAFQRSLFLLGAGLFALAAAEWALAPAPRSSRWRPLAQASLGVYLIHPFVLAVVRWQVPALLDLAWLLWVVVATVSLGLVFVMLRIPVLRRLVSLR